MGVLLILRMANIQLPALLGNWNGEIAHPLRRLRRRLADEYGETS